MTKTSTDISYAEIFQSETSGLKGPLDENMHRQNVRLLSKWFQALSRDVGFTARRAVSVCPSVRLSLACIVSKQLTELIIKQLDGIVARDSSLQISNMEHYIFRGPHHRGR